MGWFGRGIGQFTSDVGTGIDLAQQWKQRAQQMALEQARQKMEEMKMPLELQELRQRIKQMQQPQYEGMINVPGGGVSALVRMPETGELKPHELVPGMKLTDVDRRIGEMIKNAPTHTAQLLLSSIRQRVNDPNADPAAILKDAETANEKYIGSMKPAKKPTIMGGNVVTYDEEGNETSRKILVNGKLNPELEGEAKEIAQGAIEWNQLQYGQKLQLQNERTKAWGDMYAKMRGQVQMYSVIDKTTGEPIMVNANTINASPGRYGAANLNQQLINREGIFKELKTTIDQFDQALAGLTDADFKALPRAELALVLKSNDPTSAWDEFQTSVVADQLSPPQMKYAIMLRSLAESAMALRTVGGQGQGSDMLRGAVLGMLPGAATPSRAYARQQMVVFKNQYNALHQTVPQSIQNMGAGGGAQSFGNELDQQMGTSF